MSIDPADFGGSLYRRWVVERTFAWMSRCRRLAKDFERTLASSVAWAQLAACRFPARRLARNASA
ncbi:MAG: transposase [Boseongicola sp. SB0677_bin_26]|nr:transposase [Boseongicola sp. SB0665_bin_10]MYG27589.1 transposase [Boseongicola sp. SB0677_bin_26]